MQPDIYLDNAATSYPKPEVVYRAVEQFMRECGGTPARGRHPKAAEAGRILGDCRERLRRLLGAASDQQLVFTSGATESVNLALKGFLSEGAHVVVTELEHNSVMRPLAALRKSRGVTWTVAPARADGTVDAADIASSFRPETRLVAVTHASNVLGTPVDVAAIAKVAHDRGVSILVDAAQTVGVWPVDASAVDFLAFTAHKSLYGPSATGGLIFREALDLAPLKEGGTGTFSEDVEQPRRGAERFESGSHNMYGIAGLRAGVEYVESRTIAAMHRHKSALVRRLREELGRVPGVKFYGSHETVGIVSFNVAGRPSEEVADRLWENAHLMVRAGLHCAPYIHERLGTRGQGTVRVGVGFATTDADIDRLVRCVAEMR